MAETLVSPGVLARENDQSFIQQGPVTVGAAIVGPTVMGPVEVPTVVTSYTDYLATFGSDFRSGSANYSFLTSISAYNYFQQGGESLLVTRVTSGSFTAATADHISASDDPSNAPFALETLSEGVIANSTGSLDSAGALGSGSRENVRWEITNTNTGSGTFTLLVRRGDDTNAEKVILETWNNLSLDPLSNQYIESVIGNTSYQVATDGSDTFLRNTGEYVNRSRYIRVSSVTRTTPNYFDNAGNFKPEFTGSLPAEGSGSFGGAVGDIIPTGSVIGAANYYDAINATNTQGILPADYNDALALLANQDDYRYNVLTAPGLINQHHTSTLTTLISNTETRGDAIAVVDMVEHGANVGTAVAQATSRDTSYASTYWPWVQTVDPATGKTVWVPASTMIPGVYAFTDSTSEAWFAPAGLTRGGLGTVVRAERKLPAGTRDTLYDNNINPIATFPQQGVVVFGQKTLQRKASALDRVNVRRLLIELKNFISQISDNLVFEQNSRQTRQAFLTQVNPYLSSVQSRQGLYAYRVIMDDSNNTADVIDRNELVGQIYLQPTRTAEFILLDFNVQPTGATFGA